MRIPMKMPSDLILLLQDLTSRRTWLDLPAQINMDAPSSGSLDLDEDPDKWKDEKDIPEDAEAWKGEADTPQGRGEEPPEPAEPPSKKQRRSGSAERLRGGTAERRGSGERQAPIRGPSVTVTRRLWGRLVLKRWHDPAADGEAFTVRTSSSALGCKLRQIISDRLPPKAGARVAVQIGSVALMPDKTLKEQGLTSGTSSVSYIYEASNLREAWRSLHSDADLQDPKAWEGITYVSGISSVEQLRAIHKSRLQSLAFRPSYYHSGIALPSNLTWPNQLQRLKFKGACQQSLAFTTLPDSLQCLTFGKHFNQSLEQTDWPRNLQQLSLGTHFNQSLAHVTFPSCLELLQWHERCLGLAELPSLQELQIGKALNFAFRRKCFKCKAEKPRNEGDWICTLCSGLNSMHQRECFRCGEPTDEQDEPKKEAPAPLTLFSSDHPEDKAEEGEDAVEGEAAEGEEAAEEAEEEERSSPVPPKSPPPRMASPVRTSPPRFPPPQPKGPPPKHRANASRSPPRLPSAPPKGLAPQAKSGLPAKAAPRSGPPPRKERGLPKQTPKELPKAVPEEVMKEVAPQEAVKVFARLSPSFKKSWVQYCRMLRDTSDPSKLELEFIQQFLDYLGALIEADLPPQPSLPPLATKPKEATVSIRRSVVDCITKLNETGKLKKELRLEKVAQFLSKLEEEKGLQVLALLRKHMLQVADPNEFVRIQASLEQRRG
ncbi:unnamed protein product [Durusdinium trenchii]|uniref:RanBP2-type domain-containing protein n=1 Tax=Durusdinium trenchii TaxID=1381693 RepID=A0ABP0MKS8_9DINO